MHSKRGLLRRFPNLVLGCDRVHSSVVDTDLPDGELVRLGSNIFHDVVTRGRLDCIPVLTPKVRILV